MAESKPSAASEPNASSASKPEVPVDAKPKPAKPLGPPNPIWKYLGFGENFRPKLPTRNWTIFLTITGGFTAAVVYDKREKRRAQKKWCKLVEHIAKEPLDAKAMPRKLTVFLEGPPTDGLRVAQDHFKDYVKPILVASGLDWEFVQGRKEGDVRAELAERIRESRLPPEERTEEDVVTATRRNSSVKEFEGPRGDIVLGRHTWKEYVRGVHEGWLGPLTEPPKQVEDTKEKETFETMPGITLLSEPKEAEATPAAEAKTDDKPKKPPQPSPFISVSAYPDAPTPANLPTELDPSTPISFPHILGFLNTPKRLYRFLNRRVLADSIGRETAAIILSTYRPYHTSTTSDAPTSFSAEGADEEAQNGSNDSSVPQTAEQQTALIEEEKEWHKKARVRVDGEPERTWLEPIVLDPRIASRMRRFELRPEDEARARTITVPEEEIEGTIKGGIRYLGREGIKMLGFGQEKKHEPVAGDGEDVLQ
ncbi:related to TIM54 (component of the mitochondrial TIM22 translocase) [Rhynchosporium secalis]|uniref:Mitochondrial import inner membrane translocase subunit TIM54 n=1 Tax=Rhynchosporium secalis TaxID=38038 RepID=A0A1E1MH93_RHYSE|nr:related to TIM54 (component of the mitochondrial TIM22 translocase) [Rhynchosporium secalis]